MIKQGGQSVSAVNRGMGDKENGITFFECLVLELLEYYGVTWGDYPIRESCELLFAEYHWMTAAELKHFAQKLKAAQYGKMYGNFKPAILMECFADYSADALRARAGYQQRKETKELELQPGDVGPERVQQALKEMVEKWAEDIYAEHPHIAKKDTYQDKLKAWMIANGIDPQKFLNQDPETVAKYEQLIANLKAA